MKSVLNKIKNIWLRFVGFCRNNGVSLSAKVYFVDALGAMAQGLFCSLLIGTILDTLGSQLGIGVLTATVFTLNDVGYTVGKCCSLLAGPAMAVSIGNSLKAPPLVLFSLIPVGFATNQIGGAGGPLAVFVTACIACEIGKLVSKKTKVDILVTPLVTVLCGVGLAALIAAPIGTAASAVGRLIVWATEQQPFVMGIIVSVVVGICLTLPISSAAICAALSLTGLAGGAAVAGCCANMVGFAVLSFKENRWGGLVSQGIGTSMLQMGNIIKNPRIWIPPIIASAITGPIATCVFGMTMNGAPVNSGMGTCGLCGLIGVWTGWVSPSDAAIANGATAITPTAFDWIGLFLVCIILPAIICWLLGMLLRKIGWIKEGDLKLD